MINKITDGTTSLHEEVSTGRFDEDISHICITNVNTKILNSLRLGLGDLVTYTDFDLFWRRND